MAAPMRPELVGLRGAADTDFGRSDAAQITKSAAARQRFDTDGHRLSARHHAIPDAPRRAVPGWVRWSADRWAECG
jgi:hypothetical protein